MPHPGRIRFLPLLFILPLIAVPAMAGDDHRDGNHFHARLIGYQEGPAVSTQGSGEFHADISPDQQSISWTLTYSGLQADATQSHIHFGQRSVNGGIVIWLCQTASTAANNTGPTAHTCGARSDSFSGTATSDNVVAITGANAPQQIAAHELAEVIAAIRAGVAYANVHTTVSPGGEIRGQIRRGGESDHDRR